MFVLDFDGVIVDSESEISVSGFRAAQQYWCDLLPGGGTETEDARAVLHSMRAVRPRLVAGYETMVMVGAANTLSDITHSYRRRCAGI